MYIREADISSIVPKKFPDIHTPGEKILFRSRIFLSDSGNRLSGYTILIAYE
jgi:hypothetical protein